MENNRFVTANKYAFWFLKGMKSLKDSGVKTTWIKVKKVIFRKKTLKIVSKNFYLNEDVRKKQEITEFNKNIKFSILVPLYNISEIFLNEMISSVQNQTYQNWELCLADGSDEMHHYVAEICLKLAAKDNRIRYKRLEQNYGISGNTNRCLDMAEGDYICLFDHDDILHPSALYEVMKVICHEDADFIYTDEATFFQKIDNIMSVHCKPEYAIDNLRANNYICHFSVFSRELYNIVGGFRSIYDGSQDHDMILRLTDKAKKIVRIPRILYYWRIHEGSVASDINSKQYAVQAGIHAVKEHLREKGIEAEVESSQAFPTIYRIKYAIKGKPLISIVIINETVEKTERCIASIKNKTSYSRYEILVVEFYRKHRKIIEVYPDLCFDGNIKIIDHTASKNWAEMYQEAVKKAEGEYLIFLNCHTEVLNETWVEEMLMYAQRDDVGAVGAKLYRADGTIQHAGMILGLGEDRIAGNIYYGLLQDDFGYMGKLGYAQNFSAVSGLCMMVKKNTYFMVGGFSEDVILAYIDVDFCLKLRERGCLNVWTPYAELIYHGAEKYDLCRGDRREEAILQFKEKWWKVFNQCDVYYNRNFSFNDVDYLLNIQS